MKTGILCHGRYLQAINWELHQFGHPEVGLGQILKTCLLANQKSPEVIVFGTGASEKDGIKEADYTIRYMLEHFDALKSFPQFAGLDIQNLREYMVSHSVSETKSQNTKEEIARASEIFANRGIEEAILVSNPDHIPRCFQLAHDFAQSNKPGFYFLAAQSDIGYNGTPRITSRIIEKPHRADDPSPDLSAVIGDYFKLTPVQKTEFTQRTKAYFEECISGKK